VSETTIHRTVCDACHAYINQQNPKGWATVHLGYGNYLDFCKLCSRPEIIDRQLAEWGIVGIRCQQCDALVCFCGRT